MVELEIDLHGGYLHIRPRGLHRVWTLKNHIKVRLSQVVSVRRAPADYLKAWGHGWRLPGTHIPHLIVAGSYLKDGDWSFWDMTKPDHTIEIELKGHKYQRLIIDVSNPAEKIAKLQALLAA